jgi:hypothetical protein
VLGVDSCQHKQKVVQYQFLKNHLLNTIDYFEKIWEYNHARTTNLNQPLLGVQNMYTMQVPTYPN